LEKVAPAGQLSMPKLEMPKPDNPGNNKLQARNDNVQISNKIKSQLFGILNFGHCDLFGICVLLFEVLYYRNPNTDT
jgi:hypothetical protein